MSSIYTATRTHKILAGLILGYCLIFTSLEVQSAFANSVTLQWASNSEPDLIGYKVYQGTTPGSYGLPIDVGNTTEYTAQNLQAGLTYYFSITAYDNNGNESTPSYEVSQQIPTPPSKVIQPGFISSMSSPTLENSTEVFSWKGLGVEGTKWWLYIGTSTGKRDVYNSGSLGMATEVTVSGLPTDGGTLYVRLWYREGDGWKYWDASYIAS